IHQRLRANSDYRIRFADHVQRHLTGDGALTPAKAAALYQQLIDEVDRAITGESARWGDNRRSVPYTRQDWLKTQQRVLSDYFPRRSAIVLQQLRDQGLVSQLEAPRILINGQAIDHGQVLPGSLLTIQANRGTIYYTLDGSDPRLPGGAISD